MIEATLIGFGRFGRLFHKFFCDDFYLDIYDKNLTVKEKSENAGEVWDIPWKDNKIIFLSVPISEIENISLELKDKISESCTIVDFCSVKKYPLQILKTYFPKNPIFSIHPLFGPDSVENSLENHIAIVIKNEHWNSVIAYFWQLLIDRGVRLFLMNEDEHDELIAWTLCLTQYIGRSIGNLKIPYDQIATKGFIELMNIVHRSNADTQQLFIDINKYNPYAEEMRKKVIESFIQVDDFLIKQK